MIRVYTHIKYMCVIVCVFVFVYYECINIKKEYGIIDEGSHLDIFF